LAAIVVEGVSAGDQAAEDAAGLDLGKLAVVADEHGEGRAHGDELRRDTFATWPAGTLRNGVNVEDAVDVYAALSNIDVYRELIDERYWTPDRVQAWWTSTLTHTLLG